MYTGITIPDLATTMTMMVANQAFEEKYESYFSIKGDLVIKVQKNGFEGYLTVEPREIKVEVWNSTDMEAAPFKKTFPHTCMWGRAMNKTLDEAKARHDSIDKK